MNNYSNPVNATFLQKSNGQGKSANFTTKRSARVQDNSSNFSEGRRCYRCNSCRHLANDPTCPANGEQCRNCKKIGHFARVCRSTKGNQQGVKVHYSGKKHNQVREVNLFPKESFSDTLHRTEAEKEAEIQVLTLVDTGSGVTILGKDLFDKHFLREALVPPPRDRTFSSYTQHEIDIIGCFRALVKYQGFNQGKVLCEPSTLRDKVKGTQDYYKNFCDKKVHTKVVRFNVGDYVRIKKPHPGLKGDSKFSDPIQIRQKLSDKVYITSDGRKWHVDKLIPSTANLQTLESSEQDSFLSFGELEETGEGVESESSGSGSPYPVRRSTRVRRLPQ
ncbi:hypothetical protein HOLleu_38057 [Holothuria leucospilota]|uniref:CCHC-type domain-containing protein n=1 Tax=Holothuria leucospilota TaxID=206669 RepID=A0A9Q0YI77_HOLLE|nr:hypothetical protein HOLleu_38057 [Holothuria leucospilota]